MNNAGLAQLGSAVQSNLEVDQAIMNVNVLGTISLTKAVLPHMIHNKQGQIVVISSASGKSGEFKIKFMLMCLFVMYSVHVRDFFRLNDRISIVVRSSLHSDNYIILQYCFWNKKEKLIMVLVIIPFWCLLTGDHSFSNVMCYM